MAQRYNNSAGHTNKSFVYAVMQGLCGPATEKSGCATILLLGVKVDVPLLRIAKCYAESVIEEKEVSDKDDKLTNSL